MEKNQNATGMTLSFRLSEAIHWITKRMEKNACPTNPTDSQKCSLLISCLLRNARPVVNQNRCPSQAPAEAASLTPIGLSTPCSGGNADDPVLCCKEKPRGHSRNGPMT